jgi:regulator of protease activity HflC (stomatin/prohibitin superfamily)
MHDWARHRNAVYWMQPPDELLLPDERSWIARHTIEVVCGALILLVLFGVMEERIFIPVASGQRAVRWSRFFGGTVDEVYGEGMHIVPPWDEVTTYDVRVQEITAPVRVLTAGGLDVVLRISIRFRPRIDRLADLHTRFGPDYARKLVVQEVSSTLQRVLGDRAYDNLTLSGTYTAALRDTVAYARAQLDRESVEIEDVVIEQITLPPELAQAIHDKLREQQMVELLRYRVEQAKREAERKAIEADGIRRFQQIVSASLDERYLRLRGIEATVELAKSNNAKLVLVGRGADGLPILFDPTSGAKP